MVETKIAASRWPADTIGMMANAKQEPADKPMAKPPAKRRWYQFSLWSMFVWVTVIGALLAAGMIWMVPAQQQRTAVQMFEGMGGAVQYADPPADEFKVVAQLREWLPRDYFDSVTLVYLDHSRASSDADMAYLESLTQLEVLILNGTQITDAGLVYVKNLKHLKSLSLIHTRISDAGLVHLKNLTQLQTLELDYTQITDTGLAQVEDLTHLSTLSICGAKVSTQGLAKLQKALPNCRIDH